LALPHAITPPSPYTAAKPSAVLYIAVILVRLVCTAATSLSEDRVVPGGHKPVALQSCQCQCRVSEIEHILADGGQGAVTGITCRIQAIRHEALVFLHSHKCKDT
jgi:hypothetical protein